MGPVVVLGEKARPLGLYLLESWVHGQPGEHLEAELVQAACEQFEETHGYYPKVIIEEKGGLIVIEENERSVKNVQEVYLDQMKISMLSENFGGPHFMSPEQIRFIDNWEVEHYRRKIAKKG